MATSSSSASSAPVPSSTLSSSKKTLRSNDTTSTFATKLGVQESLLTLHSTANLDTTARKRGPNPFDLRSGVPAREEIDLTAHLEETIIPKQTRDYNIQFDLMLPPPPLPAYTSAAPKRGVDNETQVTPGTREWQPTGTTGTGTDVLFNFDDEIAPMVESTTDDILAQAAEEIAHEEELVALTARRETVQAVLDRDTAYMQDLENQAKALADKQVQKVKEARQVYSRAVDAMEKVAASSVAKNALHNDYLPNAMQKLSTGGHFYDPTVRDIEENVLPDILNNVQQAIDQRTEADDVLGKVVQEALLAADKAYAERVAKDKEEEAELKREYFIRVYVRVPRRSEDIATNGILSHGTQIPIDDNCVGATEYRNHYGNETPLPTVEVFDSNDGSIRTVVVGPVSVTKLDSVHLVESRIHTWLLNNSNVHTRRIVAMAGGKDAPLVLYLNGSRLSSDTILLARPLESLGGLELKPSNTGGWVLDIPEESNPTESSAA